MCDHWRFRGVSRLAWQASMDPHEQVDLAAEHPEVFQR